MKTKNQPKSPVKEREKDTSAVPTFPASSDLARSLQSLQHEQQEIDRAEAERIAKLREIQSLD